MAARKSVQFLPAYTPCAVVRGSTHRGGRVRRTATSATRLTAATSSDFVLPRTNPFPFSKDPCVGVGSANPPAPY